MPITRSANVLSTGVYSCDGEFRYSLTRCWDSELAKLLLIMHNPSKATEIMNDETVMTCENVARQIGNPAERAVHPPLVCQLPAFGSIRVCNLYPVFSTNPSEMGPAPPEAIGENDHAIRCSCRWADWVICAWGTGADPDRARSVEQIVRDAKDRERILCFGDGQPLHPMGVKKGSKYKGPTEEKLLLSLSYWCSPVCLSA